MTDLRALRGGRSRRERPAADAVVRGLERAVIGAVFWEPARIPAVAEILSERDFADPRLGLVFGRWCGMYREGLGMTLPALSDEFDRRDELERIGGDGELAALSDAADSGMWAVEHARRVRRLALERHVALLHERAAAGIREPGDLDEIVRIEGEIASLEAPPAAAIESIGFTGDALREVADEPEPPSPLSGLLDPLPSLEELIGRPKVGKTRFGLHLAQSWACGVPPWPGADRLPGTRALVISGEQSARRGTATLRQLAEWNQEEPRDNWPERMVVIARDRRLPREARALFTLDAAGRALLRRILEAAAEAGDPFGFVLLDSVSRLKPAEAEENDADAMTAFLDPLAAMATDLSVYMLAIHHQGHEDRPNPVNAARGSSAIAAVAQAVLKFEIAEGRPSQRIVTATGNAIETSTLVLDVAPDDQPGRVLYFRPADPCAGYVLDDLIPAGAALSENAIAKKLSGKDKPDGAATRKARLLVDAWAKKGKLHRDPPLGRGKPALIRRRVDVED